MAFTIPLHYIRAFLIIDVFNTVPHIGTNSLAIQPANVCAADTVFREAAEMGDGQGLGSNAWAIAEDTPAGWGGKHGVAEAIDEVGRCSCFAEGRYHVCGWQD